MEETRWDLSQLVYNCDPYALKLQMRSMVKDAAALADKYRGKVVAMSPEDIRGMLQAKDDLFLTYEGPMLYCALSFYADSTDPVANELYGTYNDATTEAGQHLAFMSIELGRRLDSEPELIDDPALADYRHYLEKALRTAPYLLTEAEEKVIMAKDQNGVVGWSKLQGRWLSTRTFRMEVDGGERELTMGEIYTYMYHQDRDTRRRAYQAIGGTLARDEALWAEVLAAICGDHASMCKLRRYPSVLTSSLIANDVEAAAIDALMSTVARNADLCQRFFRLKARLMGLEKLGNWDLRAPLPHSPDLKFEWSEARELLISTYSGFDAQLGGWVEDMYGLRHLDGEVRKGKRTGAFCETWVAGRSAYILQSYNGSTNDLFTQAHELGHAVHAYLYTRKQNPSNCQVSLCVAECGSIFGELLLTERLLRDARNDGEKEAALVRLLNGFAQTVFQEGFRFFFEKSLYDVLSAGKQLTGERISDLWTSAQRSIYGDTVDFLPESRWEWARFPHHYFHDLRFYNYPYIFAQLFVFALYSMYKEEGEAFVPKLRSLLEAGGSRSAAQLAAELGFDISKEAFWQRGMDQAEAFLRELESCSR